MKSKLLILFCSLAWSFCFAQNAHVIDSLKVALKHADADSARYFLLEELFLEYVEYKNDSALYYIEQQIAIAGKNNWEMALAHGLDSKGYALMISGRFTESYRTHKKAFEIAENPANEAQDCFPVSKGTPHEIQLWVLGNVHQSFGHLMGAINKIDELIFHFKEAESLGKEINDNELLGLVNMNLGWVYL